MDKKQRKEIIRHLHYIHPQLHWAEKALNCQTDPHLIFAQLKAAEAILNKIIYKYFDEALRKHIAATINHLLNNFHLDPESLQTLIHIKSSFPRYKLHHLPKIYHQLKIIEQKCAS